MPKFSQVELFLDGTYTKHEQVEFIFKSRSICSYLERGLADIDFETTLSRVNIWCSKENVQKKPRRLKAAPYLEVWIKYDFPESAKGKMNLMYQEYLKIIQYGLKEAELFMPIPYDFCSKRLHRFVDSGCINKWVHVKKEWKGLSYTGVAEAEVNSEKFTLYLTFYKKGEIINRKKIVETKPREMLFLPFLGNFSLEKNRFVFYKNGKKIISKFNLSEGKFEE